MGHFSVTVPPPTTSQPASTNLCGLLARASHSLTTELQAGLEQLGISARAHQVLTTAADGEHTQSDIARIVGLDKTTMVVTMDELEAAGLAERRPSASDRRARVIVVTPAGEQKVLEGERIVSAIHEDVLGMLSDDERRVFLDALVRMTDTRLSMPVACTHPVRRRPVRT
jgi:MarR family transcriptional regulator for hemolysin